MAAVNFRKAVTGFTDVIFPVPPADLKTVGRYVSPSSYGEYTSSLPFQMLLFFNVYFLPPWFISYFFVFIEKFEYLDVVYRITVVSAFVVMTLVEVTRLYLGYVGNLTEQVPELAGSWLLTFILQLPLCSFLLFNTNALIQPLELAINIVLFVFLVLETITGYFAVKTLINHQVMRFHVRQLAHHDDKVSTAVKDNPAFRLDDT